MKTQLSHIVLSSLTAGLLLAGCGEDANSSNNGSNNVTNNVSNNGANNGNNRTNNGISNNGTSNNGTNNGTLSPIKVLSVDELTTTSAQNYEDNTYGIVTAKTVANWVTDWENTRPENINGKLIIFQVGQTFAGSDENYKYIKHDGVNVFTFDRTAGCTTTGVSRFDGVSNIPKPVFTGQEMDGAFQAYDIDPNNDLLLMVAGVPGEDKAGDYFAGAARMWYTLTYWGVVPKNLAILDGQASVVLNPELNTDLAALSKDDLFGATESVPPMNGTHTINEVRQDGTILQATTEDMMAVAKDGQNAFIIDARSEPEYVGDRDTKKSKMEDSVCGVNGDEQCYAAFEGHIKGAKNIEYREVFVIDEPTTDVTGDGELDAFDASFRYKSMDELNQILTDAGYEDGQTVYSYCRTGTRAVTTAFAASTILGLPTRLYDGSWTQWGKLANNKDTNQAHLLEEDDKWRVDTAEYSENITYNEPIEVNPMNRYEKDGAGTDGVIQTDKAYKE